MPPNFFQKLVNKSPPSAGHDRRTSDDSPPSRRASTTSRRRTESSMSNGRGSTPIPSEPVPPLPANASSLSAKSTGARKAVPSLENGVNGSPNANVNVVPPSPRAAEGGAVERTPQSQMGLTNGKIEGLPEDSSRDSATLIPDRATRSPSPTPSATERAASPTPQPRPKSPAPSQHSSSTAQEPREQTSTALNGKAPSRPSTTTKEMTPDRAASAVSHMRAATMPNANTRSDEVHGGDGPPVPSYAMSQVHDSPTELRGPSLGSAPHSPELGTANGSTLITPSSSQISSDTSSVLYTPTPAASSTFGQRDVAKKKPTSAGAARTTWKPAPGKKPTGLASAIAASGLSMANPAVSRQLSPPGAAPRTRQPSLPGASYGPLGTSGSLPQSGVSLTSDTSPRSSHSRSRQGSTSKKRRNGSLSVSVHSDASERNLAADDVAEASYYSGLESDSSDEEEDSSEREGLMDLDFGEDDLPVTGFAVASSRRNSEFHELFPQIPEGDYLIEDYGCALQREILIQGRLYISENHICFHANIFGWITDLSIPIHEVIALEKKMTALFIPNAILIATRQTKYSFASFLSRDTTYDVIYNIWRLARPSDAASMASSGHESVDRVGIGGIVEGTVVGAGEEGVVVGGNVVGKVKKKVTQCACVKEGKHFAETALDAIFPGTPDRIHNLMFASGFMKDFLTEDQKLIDIQISDWAPIDADSRLLARNMSYIKPLNASVGPKSTKCEIRDETLYCDFEDFVTTLTTTRTPDVPSGGVFSVKTKTCITFAGAMSTRVVVTTEVEWTGRSFIKGIIERSCIDGQKVYHADLEKAMRTYIQEHQSEFLPEGMDVDAVAPVVTEVTPVQIEGEPLSAKEKSQRREHERNQRSLQWAYDTFEGARRVAVDSTKGALELVRDAWDQSTTTTILYFLIVLLVFSNIYTLMRMGAKEEIGRKKEMRKAEERERWVQGVVTAIWEELAAGKIAGANGFGGAVGSLDSSGAFDPANWKQEVASLQETLDLVEQRTHKIKEALTSIEENISAQADVD